MSSTSRQSWTNEEWDIYIKALKAHLEKLAPLVLLAET